MKRFLTSVITIAAVFGIGYLSSVAFFSDSETSTGNLFQAGAVDLKVDSECHYYHYNPSHPNAINNQALGILGYYDVGCGDFGTWDSTDLTQEKFFNFTDVKPGDLGETTLSLTVVDNDAWACMYVENVIDAENDRIDPEVEAGDLTDDPQGGELAKNLKFTAWLDQGIKEGWQGKYVDEATGDKGEGDNFWQGQSTEPLLFVNQPITSEGVALALADAAAIGGPLKGGVTHYFGLAWCAGDMVVGPGNTLFCNGEPMGNEAQTDSLTADVRFYVEQARNNPNFVCPPPEQADPWIDAVGALNDEEATSPLWYMRHVGNPAPDGYSHAYQWGPALTCDPNNTPVTFSGTIDVNSMVTGNVSMIGLLDKGLMEVPATGYQSGAYLYVFKRTDSTLRIGPSDGNAGGGEMVQVFKDYPIDDGILNIDMTISAQKITIIVDGDTAIIDDYGEVKTSGNVNAYVWDEFASGAYPGWDNYPTTNYMPYDLTITGCN